MLTNEDKYSEIMTDLISEAIACSPESWERGTLTIVCDGRRIDYKLKNEGHEESASISDELRAFCEDFWVAFRDNGEEWHTSIITFYLEGDEWKFETEFHYASSNQGQTTV